MVCRGGKGFCQIIEKLAGFEITIIRLRLSSWIEQQNK